jgi:hypothetical protein
MGMLTERAAREGGGGFLRPRALALGVLATLLFAAAVLSMARVPFDQLANHLEARSWPVAPAHIVSVSLSRELEYRGERLEPRLRLAVAYEFEAEGRSFRAHSASIEDVAAPHERRLQLLFRRIDFARITGRTMPASYDPIDPESAFLDASMPWGPVFRHGLSGLALALAGAAALVAASRRPRI